MSSRQGRQKLHHLNVARIRLVHDRWISKFVTRRDDGENLIGLHSILLARSLAGSPNPPGACRGSGLKSARMSIEYQWRGDIENDEVNALHAEAFETRLLADEWDWQSIVRQSLGWVVARDDGRLVGFVNVIWDGSVHAWIQDTMVASGSRERGSGHTSSRWPGSRQATLAASGCTLTSRMTSEASTTKLVDSSQPRLASSIATQPLRDCP